jgi:hypothetical protein
MAIVVAGGNVVANDAIIVLPPPQPHQPLIPV